MWADNEAAVDLLNVKHLVAAILRVTRDDRLDPVTVGVYGDWGSGKSSVIQLVRQQIEKDPDLFCVYFNGWRFEGYEDAKAALASTILDGIEKEKRKSAGKLSKAKTSLWDTAKSLASRVDRLRASKMFGGIGVNAGIAAGGAALAATSVGLPAAAGLIGAAALASLLKDVKEIDGEVLADLLQKKDEADAKTRNDARDSIRGFRDEFAKLVSELGVKRLIVIVDDLDRCLPANVIDTLEAIRLYLSVPKTSFVIAADEALIRDAVAQRYPDRQLSGDERDRERARATTGARYLEKFVQVPVRIPPLSRSDLHGYLNLLFADQRMHVAAEFAALCERAHSGCAYDSIPFHAGNAEALLKAPVPDDLKQDLVLAEQIAPVLALCSEGNPRQTKRFLNALILRVDMAADRGVTLDRATTAKLLLLEYFLPELFRPLALAAVASEGTVAELRALEETERSVASSADQNKVTSATHSSDFRAVATAMKATDRFQAWVRAEPALGSVDLRPYIYFAHERYAIPIGIAQRLTPNGAQVLRDFLTDSEATQSSAAQRAKALPLADVVGIVTELSAQARLGNSDLTARTSPFHAMTKLAQNRIEIGGDVVASMLNMPLNMLPANVAILVESLGKIASLVEPAKGALNHWSTQSENTALQTASLARLKKLNS